MNGKKWVIGSLLMLATILLFTGCIGTSDTTPTTTTTLPREDPKSLDINTIILYTPLGGHTTKAGEAFLILAGNSEEVQQKFREIITQEIKAPKEFKADEKLSLVVFRGVFSSGGHSIDIDNVLKTENSIIIKATYSDPGSGMMVSQAFTQPTAFIPLGHLETGNYEAVLVVSRVLEGEKTTKILEDNVEQGRIEFEVK